MEKKNIIRILEKWSKKYKRSIDCNTPKGFSQKAHCTGRKKRKYGGKTKSRPSESFVQENKMKNLKEFFVNEVNSAIKKEMIKKKLKESSKDLYEAVNLESNLIKENAKENKLDLASKAVRIAEIKVLENYDELDGGCDCGEGEGRMLKAQLLSIMTNAQKLFHMISEDDQFEDWVQSKITIAEDYLRASYGYLTYYNGEGEADESDFDDDEYDEYDEEDFDEVDEESFESENKDIYVNVINLDSALNPNVDDDKFFESKKSKKEVR